MEAGAGVRGGGLEPLIPIRALGYFDLTELAEVTVFRSVPAVERDLYSEPTTLGEIKKQSRLAA